MTVFFDVREELLLESHWEDALEDIISIALRSEGIDGEYELSFSFVSEDEIQALNRDYRGKDAVTDVLSFPVEQDFTMEVESLGDIVICLPRAAQQAEEIGHDLFTEVTYLTVHSVMHLLGYDHETDEDKQEMRAAEKKALQEVEHAKTKTTQN